MKICLIEFPFVIITILLFITKQDKRSSKRAKRFFCQLLFCKETSNTTVLTL